MKGLKKAMIAGAAALAVILACLLGTYTWYRMTHVKVGNTVYDTRVETLDLRGRHITPEIYDQLRAEMPETEIIWELPFQGKQIPEDTRELTLTTLSLEEAELLDYLPRLETVHAEDCRDYEALEALEQRRQDVKVDFSIHLGENALDRNTESLELPGETITYEDLASALPHLKNLKVLSILDPVIPGKQLKELRDAYPQVDISWVKTIYDVLYPMDIQELDISNHVPESLEAVEAMADYFPELQKLVMVECGFDNDTMAAFREKVRDKYLVVWGVQVGEAYLRTDDQGFIPSAHNKRVNNEALNNLKYCEGLLAVDLGHIGVGNLSWVTGTPHLKYLIVGDGNVHDEDVAHLSACQELEYLEIFMTPVKDISPLVECKALKDLNLSRSYVDITPLLEMTWLDNLWLLGNKTRYEDRLLLEEKLPNTRIETGYHSTCHGRGWRNMDSYYEMRDILGMWYMKG